MAQILKSVEVLGLSACMAVIHRLSLQGRIMRPLFMGGLALVVNACATTADSIGTVRFDISPAVQTEFTFIDSRPNEERTTSTLHKANSTVIHIGDDRLTPTAPLLLQAMLQQKLGTQLAGKKVVLSSLEIEIRDYDSDVDVNDYYKSSVQSTGVGAVPAVLGGLAILGIEGRRRVVYVAFEGALGEKQFNIDDSMSFKGSVGAEEVKRAVLLAIDRLISSLARYYVND